MFTMPRTGKNIYKRKDGKWEGRCARKRIDSADSKSLPADDTLADIASEWFKISMPLFKESTSVKYKNMLRLYILPAIGDCPISEITNETIRAFCNDLLHAGGAKKSGLSPKSVADILSLLRNIQKYALSQNMNTALSAFSCPVKHAQKQLRIFSRREQTLLCNYLKSDMTLCNLGVILCLFTGIRLGELCALKWGDISITEKTIHIQRTMQRLHTDDSRTAKTRILLSSPKSPCSIRFIPLPDPLMECLIPMQKHPDSFFLTGEAATFIEPRRMQYHFKRILNACGIQAANFHMLRHTFATRCIESGFDLKSLSEILGHANVNITLNRYVHPTLELKRAHMAKMFEPFSVG